MKSDRHLLLLTPGFPKDEADDICMPYLQDYLLALRAQKPELKITVIAFQYPFRKGEYRWHGIEVHSLGGKNHRWRKLMIWHKAQKLALKLNRQVPVDVIHSLWLREATWVGQKVARKIGCLLVGSLMGQDAGRGNGYLKRLDLERLIVTAPSQRCAEAFQQNSRLGKLPVVLPWTFAAKTGLGEEKERDIDVLGVGSLIPLKKHDRFLRVIRLLADKRPQLRVCLVGQGPQRKALERQASELGIAHLVEFAGGLSRAEVFERMKRSKVLLHTALEEGQGYVLAEALIHGMHVVSSPVGMAQAMEKCSVWADAIRQAEAVGRYLDVPVDFAPRGGGDVEGLVNGFLKCYGLYDQA